MDDLNTKPEGTSLTTPDVAWQKAATYEELVAKVYASMAVSGNNGPSGLVDIQGSDEGETTFLRSYWNLQELTTDEAICAWHDDGLDGLMFDKWTSSNRFTKLMYNRISMTIAYCNEYLRQTTPEKLDQWEAAAKNNTELTEPAVDDALKAKVAVWRNEVRVIRAMNYYFLMDLYANVPFVTEEDPVSMDFYPEQRGRDFLFSWLEDELKSLENHVPAKSEANYGMVNNPTIWMILAKMYLNAEVYTGTKHYTEAITYLNKIIAAGYTLDPVYKNMFGADNDKSPEIIFPIMFDGINLTCYGGTTYLMAASYKSDMDPEKNFGLNQAWQGLRAKESLSSLFGDGDKRALFWTKDRTMECPDLYDFNSGWSVVKYTNKTSTGQIGSNPAFPDTDFPLFRLADAYLMYAEAVLRGGEGGARANALNYVNELRTRAGVAKINDYDLKLDFILDERARELYWEGHRRTDLIRFNKFTSDYRWPWKNGVYFGTATISDKYKLFPIPVTELSANPNMKQNTGY
jgi:hypothetical protein